MTWRDVVRSPQWLEAITATTRTVGYRVEAVSATGRALGDVPVESARLTYDGQQAEQWDAKFTLTDPTMVPMGPLAILDGRSGVRLRVWWRILTASGWMECPAGTYIVEDPKIVDSGTVTITVSGLDPLTVARRGRYGSSVVRVGGMTVTAALQQLFEMAAPRMPVAISTSPVTLPSSYELWERDPAEDWTEIAAMAGFVVRTDPEGIITAGPPPSASEPVADWRDGPACPITSMTVEQRTSTIPRRVVVVSASPHVPMVIGEWINPDAATQAITTEQRIESSTVTTVDGARSMARLSGQRWAAMQESVTVTVPARPDLGYRDPVTLYRPQAGVAGVYAVAGWSLDLDGPDQPPREMTVRMMTRQ